VGVKHPLEKEAKKKDESDNAPPPSLGLGKSLPRINIITVAIIAPTGTVLFLVPLQSKKLHHKHGWSRY
jgi:hypothetical protein